MATASMPDLTGLDKTAQLDTLRRRMAAIPARRDHAPTDLTPAREQPPTQDQPSVSDSPPALRASTAFRTVPDEPPKVVPGATALRTIPVPLPLAELLPHAALARGTAISVTGAGSVLIGIVSAATAAGHHVAIIGQPRFGLLAAHEQGADLSKIALIDPGDGDPLDVASICIDGVDLVISTVRDHDIPPTRARSILARTRTHAGVFAITDGRMTGLDLTIASRPSAFGGIERGRGRLRSITIETVVHGRGISQRTGRFTLTAPSFGEQGMRWTAAEESMSTGTGPTRRLAAAQ